ncbi:hypothetical protein [Streptomyces sp. NPDC048737]|uniref:hypothetical protein n=1 Tax=unclassified Streptomyces TaxID=2593676 RepID=UPI00341438FD
MRFVDEVNQEDAGAASRPLPENRYLSDLLKASTGPVVRDERALRALLADSDPLLYTAQRDAEPHRVLPDRAGSLYWRGDLVHYTGGILADGEPVRSIGHWNPLEQLEVFQVVSGRVVLLMGDDTTPATLSISVYGPGDTAVVPRGWFHLTGAPWGPATVFNIYTDRRHGGGTDVAGKYHARAPLPYLVVMSDGVPVAEPAAGAPAEAPVLLTEPLRPAGLALPDDLRHWMRAGSTAELEALRQELEALSATDWPRAA